jgi:hypothetical protein
LRVALDWDDVVIDYWGGVCAALNREYGLNLDPSLTTDWDDNQVKNLDVFGDGRSWWEWLRDRDWLWATFDAVPGAIGGIDTLRRRGHTVEIITKKPEWAEWVVWRWLGRWRPAASTVTIIPIDANKADYSDADILIDDNAENVAAWAASGRFAILYDRPWNQHVVCDGFDSHCQRIRRAYNWDYVLGHIQERTTPLWSLTKGPTS